MDMQKNDTKNKQKSHCVKMHFLLILCIILQFVKYV